MLDLKWNFQISNERVRRFGKIIADQGCKS